MRYQIKVQSSIITAVVVNSGILPAIEVPGVPEDAELLSAALDREKNIVLTWEAEGGQFDREYMVPLTATVRVPVALPGVQVDPADFAAEPATESPAAEPAKPARRRKTDATEAPAAEPKAV
jgi:hypothetical protein